MRNRAVNADWLDEVIQRSCHPLETTSCRLEVGQTAEIASSEGASLVHFIYFLGFLLKGASPRPIAG